MQINPEIIEELILDAGEARAKKARNYKQAKKVIITETKYEDRNWKRISISLPSSRSIWNRNI